MFLFLFLLCILCSSDWFYVVIHSETYGCRAVYKFNKQTSLDVQLALLPVISLPTFVFLLYFAWPRWTETGLQYPAVV